MYFEESNPSRLSSVIWEEVGQSQLESAENSRVKASKTSPFFGSQLTDGCRQKLTQRDSRSVLKLAEQKSPEILSTPPPPETFPDLRPQIGNLVKIMRVIFDSILDKEGCPEKWESRAKGGESGCQAQMDFVVRGLKLLAKRVLELKLEKRPRSQNVGKKLLEAKIFATDDNFKPQNDKRETDLMRESAPGYLEKPDSELVFKKTVLKQRHLKSLVGEKKSRAKKRKRRTKSNQQSLYISNSKKRLKKSVKKAQNSRNKSYNRTKLTLNDNDFSYISSGVDIWGLTRRNKMLELGAKMQGYESATLDKGIVFSRPFTGKSLMKKNKSKAHFSLRKIGEAPSKLEWFQKMREKRSQCARETNSFITGFQSNFIRLSGLRNRSINSGHVSKRGKTQKGSLNRIKQKLKLTAESGSQINKPRRLNPKLDRKILTCFQKSPKLKNKKVSEFVINSPQSLNSMTLLSQKIANTSEMKTWITKIGEKKTPASKKAKARKKVKRVKRPKSKARAAATLSSPAKQVRRGRRKEDKRGKKELRLKNVLVEKPNLKNLFLKIANTTKGGQSNSISFLKIFSTKHGNEAHLDRKTNKLWELFKKQRVKQRQNKGEAKQAAKKEKEGDRFYYDDSNFNSVIQKEAKKKKKSHKKKSSKKPDFYLKNIVISEEICNRIMGNSPFCKSGKQLRRLNKSKFVSSRVLADPKENRSPNVSDQKPIKKRSQFKFKN